MEWTREFLRFVREPADEVAYQDGRILRGYSMKVKENSYLLVVKVTGRLDGHLVAFIESETHIGCFEYWYKSLTTSSAPLRYSRDRYAG